MSEGLWLFLGTVAIWIFAAWYLHSRPLERRFYAEATVAKKMGPLVDRYIKGSERILITGSDSANVKKQGYPWTEFLSNWLDKKCKVEYLLIKPDAETVSALENLVRKGMQLYVVQDEDVDSASADKQDKGLVDRLKSFHFALFYDKLGQKQQMWIEGNHPHGSTIAYDCEYVPPRLAKDDERFDHLRGIYDRVVKDYAESKSSASSSSSL